MTILSTNSWHACEMFHHSFKDSAQYSLTVHCAQCLHMSVDYIGLHDKKQQQWFIHKISRGAGTRISIVRINDNTLVNADHSHPEK